VRIYVLFVTGSLTVATTVKKQVTIATSALDACTKAEAIVIATEWKEFQQLDWPAVYEQMNKPAFVFDGRMLVDADELRRIGFTVRAIVHPPLWVRS
jgi:UDPglucose 6-dehydrogenase